MQIMGTLQKCPQCHTPLPEFGAFEKPVCPNCNRRVFRGAKPSGEDQGHLKLFFLSKPLLFWPFALCGIFYIITGAGFSMVLSFLMSLLLSLPAWYSTRNKQLRKKIQDDNPWIKNPAALRYLYRKAQLRRCLRSVAKLLIYCVCLFGILLMIALSQENSHIRTPVEDSLLKLLTFCLLTLGAFLAFAVWRWVIVLFTRKPDMADI
jgi:hypothetical protein